MTNTESYFTPVYAGIGRGWFVAELYGLRTDERGDYFTDARTSSGPYTTREQAEAAADLRNLEARL